MILIDFVLRFMYPGELSGGRVEIWETFEDEGQRYVGF